MSGCARSIATCWFDSARVRSRDGSWRYPALVPWAQPPSPRPWVTQISSAPAGSSPRDWADPAANGERWQGELGRITKRGDKYLRKLPFVGITSLVTSKA